MPAGTLTKFPGRRANSSRRRKKRKANATKRDAYRIAKQVVNRKMETKWLASQSNAGGNRCMLSNNAAQAGLNLSSVPVGTGNGNRIGTRVDAFALDFVISVKYDHTSGTGATPVYQWPVRYIIVKWKKEGFPVIPDIINHTSNSGVVQPINPKFYDEKMGLIVYDEITNVRQDMSMVVKNIHFSNKLINGELEWDDTAGDDVVDGQYYLFVITSPLYAGNEPVYNYRTVFRYKDG